MAKQSIVLMILVTSLAGCGKSDRDIERELFAYYSERPEETLVDYKVCLEAAFTSKYDEKTMKNRCNSVALADRFHRHQRHYMNNDIDNRLNIHAGKEEK